MSTNHEDSKNAMQGNRANFIADFGGVPDNSTDNGTAVAALNTAILNATEPFACDVPAGRYKTSVAPWIRNTGYSEHRGTALYGDGKQASIFVPTFQGVWCDVGDPATTNRTLFATIRGIGFRNPEYAAGSTAMRVRHAQVTLFDQFYSNADTIFELGRTNVANDVIDVSVIDPYLELAAGPAFVLNSGGLLTMFGGKINGKGTSGNILFQQHNAGQGWDRLEATGVASEQVSRLVSALGGGLANLQIMGGYSDRYLDRAILSLPAAGGTNKNWIISGHRFGAAPIPSQGVNGIELHATSGGTQNVNIVGNIFSDFGGRAILEMEGVLGVNVANNTFLNCGSSGVEVVRINGGATVVGNTIRKRAPTDPNCSYGILFDGASNPAIRKHSTNSITGYSVAEVGGVP